MHGDKSDAEHPEKCIKKNEWGAAEIRKVDGDHRSYTVFYLGPEIEVGGQTPFRLKLRDEKGTTYQEAMEKETWVRPEPVANQEDGKEEEKDENAVAALKMIFKQYDTEESGKIGPEKLERLLRDQNFDVDDVILSDILRRVDTNNDGEVDLREMIGWWQEAQDLMDHLEEALNSNDPKALEEAIKMGLRQVPPLRHQKMTEAIEVFTKQHGKELPPLLSPALRERLWELRLKTPEVCDGLLSLGIRKMDDVTAMKPEELTKCGLSLTDCGALQKHIADIPRFKEGDKVWSKYRGLRGDKHDAEHPEKSIKKNEWARG